MTVSKKWVGTSWKMNKTLADARQFAQALVNADADAVPEIQRFVIPPFTTARQVSEILTRTTVRVGAQNMHWEDEGAWTGEISAPMLVDCGLDIVELGHSERRMHFGETDETVGLKVEAAVRHGLVPLVCVGETLGERDNSETSLRLETQVRGALGYLNDEQKSRPLMFAYEPVWAIGNNGSAASAAYADARQSEIIDIARDVLGDAVPCLYGGSVNSENCQELMTCPHVDGLFIGRSAWHVKGYLDILERCALAI